MKETIRRRTNQFYSASKVTEHIHHNSWVNISPGTVGAGTVQGVAFNPVDCSAIAEFSSVSVVEVYRGQLDQKNGMVTGDAKVSPKDGSETGPARHKICWDGHQACGRYLSQHTISGNI